LWAEHLASIGAYEAAIDVAQPVSEAKPLIVEWTERAITIGGSTGARMLARVVHITPSRFDEILAKITPWLADDSADSQNWVRAFGSELVVQPTSVELRALATQTARGLVRQLSSHEANPKLVSDLLRFSGDAALREDAKQIVGRQLDVRAATTKRVPRGADTPLCDIASPIMIRRTLADAGKMAIHDAACLPDGRLLVALGELGVCLLSRDGRLQKEFAQPATKIVLSDHGDRAILIAARGEAWRLAKLDITGQRVRPWCDAHFDTFASSFDGSLWFIGRRDTVFAIDALDSQWDHLWKVHRTGSSVRAFVRDAKSLLVLFWFGDHGDLWGFSLPDFMRRTSYYMNAASNAQIADVTLSVSGRCAAFLVPADPNSPVAVAMAKNSGQGRLQWQAAEEVSSTPASPTTTVGIALHGNWLAAIDDARIRLFDAADARERAHIELEGAGRTLGVRLGDRRALVFDGFGRLISISLDTGVVDWDLRL
jgi:hypothetical protein